MCTFSQVQTTSINYKEEELVVTSSALKALSKFKREHLKCSTFPSQVNFFKLAKCCKVLRCFILKKIQENLKEKHLKSFKIDEEKENAKNIDEIFPRVPATCFMDVYYLIKCSEEGLSEFFQMLLIEEIETIPRRAVYEARERVYSVDEQMNVKCRVELLISNFQDKQELQQQGEINMSYILYAYEAHGELNAEGQLVKRHVHTNWQAYEQTLKLLMSSGVKLKIFYLLMSWKN